MVIVLIQLVTYSTEPYPKEGPYGPKKRPGTSSRSFMHPPWEDTLALSKHALPCVPDSIGLV